MARGIRPSTTRNTLALYAKSLLNAVVFFSVFMIAMPWVAHRLAPTPIPLPGSLRPVVGLTFIAVGIGVWLACLDVFSRRGRGTPFPLDAPSRLVTTGPFAAVRNPIMGAELAVIWGEAIYFCSFGLWTYAAIATVAAHLLVVHVEEPELRERFGEEFHAYASRVPRWFPHPWNCRSPQR